MRKTLFRQLLLYIIIFGIIIAVSAFIVIEYYFNEYYYDKQEDILIKYSDELLNVYNNEGIDAFIDIMDIYAIKYNMTIQLSGENNKIIYGTHIQGQGMGMGRGGRAGDYTDDIIGRVYISQSSGQKSSFTALTYLLKADDNSMLLTKISFESMDAAVSLVKRFFLILAVIISFLFLLFAFIFSRYMSKPLHKLNQIAMQMEKLDFSLRYEDKREDEIGQLGNTLNKLTKKLENTISQLKGELEKEKTLEKMRTQFTAQVSHELQTPLSVIRCYTEALSDNILNKSKKREAYNILLSETNKISKMVDDLLDLSQMDSGVYVISKNQFDFAQLIKKIFVRYQNLAESYQIKLNIDYPDDKLYYGDAFRLEQAIDNILSNAKKYVKEDGEILINLTRSINNIMLTIQNDGNPIDKKDLPHIFDSYYQGKTAIYGTGLGLSITRHIIELHDGKIDAVNIDNGVKIQISLPLSYTD